ncbi:hypothetical protein R1sor_001284 [Riccia sorocarpa]|uniref:Centromere protein Q n=1 Tax=Riccia sorocarpa TaxID=122646 RepID=A0ABD3GXY7_9MARC
MASMQLKIQKMKENFPPTEGIPHMAKVLLMMESLCASVTDIKSTLAELCKDVAGTNSSVVALQSELAVVHNKMEKMEDIHLLHKQVEKQAEVSSTQFQQLTEKSVEVEKSVDNLQAVEGQTLALQTLAAKASAPVATSSQDPRVLNDVVKTLEAKFKTYTEESRASQTAVVQEHERERLARVRKSLNLRIAGLVEEPDEDTKEVTTVFFRDVLRVADAGLESAVRVGRKGTETCDLGTGGGPFFCLPGV